jgi:membrane protease YdiL (CAAX protease family)
MKKHSTINLILIALGIICGLLFLIRINGFLDSSISSIVSNKQVNYFIFGSFIRCIILILSLFTIFKLKLSNYLGLNLKINIHNSKILIFPSAILIILFVTLPFENVISNQLLISFIIFNLLIGFAEEFSMRGLLFPILTKNFIKNKYSIFIGLIISSIIFGVIHYIGYISGDQTFKSATNQVIFAFGIGMYFGGLLIRGKNIYAISIFHGLINIIGTFDEITSNGFKTLEPDKSGEFTINFIYILTIILSISGVYLLRNYKSYQMEDL